MLHIPLDNLRVDYIAELELQFDLRAKIREMEETGETVGSEKYKKLLDNSTARARKMDEIIFNRES